VHTIKRPHLGVFFVLMPQITQKPLNLHNYLPKNGENALKMAHFNHFSILLINLKANNE
jgi:hypothetical protein